MISSLRQRFNKDEDGFTLIELMVVVLIIGILLAIAIPTFLNAQKGAKDKAAQSDIRNGMMAVRSIATEQGGLLSGMTTGPTGTLHDAEPNLTWVDTTGTTSSIGVVQEGTGPASITLWMPSKNTGKFFGATTDTTGAIVSCDGTTAAEVNTAANCTSNKTT